MALLKYVLIVQAVATVLLATRVHSFVGHSGQGKEFPNTPTIDTSCAMTLTRSNATEHASTRRAFLTSVAAAGLVTAFPKETDAKDTTRIDATDPIPRHFDSSIVSSELTATSSSGAVDLNSVFQKASKKALGGGKAGATAAVVQVISLMWLRTSMNYQYRYGGNLGGSLQKLWDEGGLPRLYQGLPFALIQGPLTRFGDTAANVGILAFLEINPSTQDLPLPIKTGLGSLTAGLWRIFLMPVDASKTAMQVEGSEGLSKLWGLVREEGPGPFYQGAVAAAAATAVGHFPWFLTYNFLNEELPQISASDDLLLSLIRSAFLGLSASCVSDICSNSLRVIKTTKQTARLADNNDENSKEISYPEVVREILDKDGLQGLFGRGLRTRLLANSIQGAVFSVLWRYFQQVGGVL